MYSPMLQRHIALARVPLDRTKPGSTVKLELPVNHRYEYFDAAVAPAAALQPGTEDRLMAKSTSAPAPAGTAARRRPRRQTGGARVEPNGVPPTAAPAIARYDAIVIGAGHNGLVNGAYLAKAGLKTLILERRHLVGGAAITEELRPGFWFTTFSYALSLLRPDIIHDLELTKHGFMPLLMPSTFAPMENGDYLILGQDHGENLREIARHSAHDADAYEAFNHDVLRVCRAIKPLLDQVPPDIFSDDPEELVALAAHRLALPRGSTRRSSTTRSGS